jgi:hypothetical protein
MNNRFRRGFGATVFTCGCCGRKTRLSGQSLGAECCLECWELAGLQNMIFDGGTVEEIAGERDRYLATIVKRGGDEAKVRREYPDLWPAA